MEGGRRGWVTGAGKEGVLEGEGVSGEVGTSAASVEETEDSVGQAVPLALERHWW